MSFRDDFTSLSEESTPSFEDDLASLTKELTSFSEVLTSLFRGLSRNVTSFLDVSSTILFVDVDDVVKTFLVVDIVVVIDVVVGARRVVVILGGDVIFCRQFFGHCPHRASE